MMTAQMTNWQRADGRAEVSQEGHGRVSGRQVDDVRMLQAPSHANTAATRSWPVSFARLRSPALVLPERS